MTDAIGRLSSALEGHYTIERELGAGGMATVYLAHDVRHDRGHIRLEPAAGAAVGIGPEQRDLRPATS